MTAEAEAERGSPTRFWIGICSGDYLATSMAYRCWGWVRMLGVAERMRPAQLNAGDRMLRPPTGYPMDTTASARPRLRPFPSCPAELFASSRIE